LSRDRGSGADITDINLCEKDLKHCRVLLLLDPNAWICVLKDDMKVCSGISGRGHDRFSTPLNAYSVNSH